MPHLEWPPLASNLVEHRDPGQEYWSSPELRATRQIYAPMTLYHGTNIPPDEMGPVLEARTCVSHTLFGKTIDDAPPTLSMSRDLHCPSARALLNEHRPEFVDMPVVFSRLIDANGVPRTFTTRMVMDALLRLRLTGYIYTKQISIFDYVYHLPRQDQAEVRFDTDQQWKDVYPITVEHIPPDIVVVDGALEKTLKFLKGVWSAWSLTMHAEQCGVKIRPTKFWADSMAYKDIE